MTTFRTRTCAIAALCAVGFLLAACGPSNSTSACGDFRALVDDVQTNKIEAVSDVVIDRLEEIGERLRTEGGDMANAGLMATSAAQAARIFPEEADETLAPVIDRIDEVCS